VDDQIILAGDINTWNVEWRSRANDQRGQLLSDFAASHGLLVANEGTTPTFRRALATSVIDFTFFRGPTISEWRVLENVSYIEYSLDVAPSSATHIPLPERPGWNFRGIRHEALMKYLALSPFCIDQRDSPIL